MTLEARILKFVQESFVAEMFTEQTFSDYKQGLVARKKKGFRDMNEEAEYLVNSLRQFALEKAPVPWERLD